MPSFTQQTATFCTRHPMVPVLIAMLVSAFFILRFNVSLPFTTNPDSIFTD